MTLARFGVANFQTNLVQPADDGGEQRVPSCFDRPSVRRTFTVAGRGGRNDPLE
jgi:hypothetical protein